MSWVLLATLAYLVYKVGTSIAAAIRACAVAIRAWTAWKDHQRKEEAKRLVQYNPPPKPVSSLSNPEVPTSCSPPLPTSAFPTSDSSPLLTSVNSLESGMGTDYTKLSDLLAAGNYREADRETLRLILWITHREKQGWLDIESIKNFPCQDLLTIDDLWVQHSDGRFGFSIQKQIFNKVGKDYEKFADEVGWRLNGKDWITYDMVLFEIRALKGHLPTSWANRLGRRHMRRHSYFFSRIET